MRIVHAAIIASFIAALTLALIWLLQNSPSDTNIVLNETSIIPKEFQGYWHDIGADCRDTDATARISGSTIDYDTLAFKVESLEKAQGDAAILAGTSFPAGRADHERVALTLQGQPAHLYISAPDLKNNGPLVRCRTESGE